MGITNQGINTSLTLIFPVSPAWFVGLINNTPSPVLDPNDTMASHPLWAEVAYVTAYTGNRPSWTNGAVSGQKITNASYVQFPILVNFTTYGILLCSSSTGASTTLFGTTQFVGGPQTVAAGDTIDVTLNVIGASS